MGAVNYEALLNQTEGYNVSDRYNVIPTIDVVQQLEKYGFETTSIQAAGTRAEGKENHQKHLVRMKSDYKMHGLRPEVVIFNSYDRTSSLQIRIGMFRFVCSNGLIAGENIMPTFKIKHSNSNWEELLNEFVDTYDEKFHLQQQWVEQMTERKMTLDEAYYVAEQVLKFRHADERINMDVVDPLELLVAKRKEDRGETAWHRYNIIQESLVNGYFHKYDNDGSIRKAKVLTNLQEIIRVNTELSDTFTEVIA